MRDAIEGECVVQAALASLLYVGHGPYLVRHELEANGGLTDIAFEPQLSVDPTIGHAARSSPSAKRSDVVSPKPILLYLGVWKGGGSGDRIQISRKLPGLERYAGVKGWQVVTVEEDHCRPEDIPLLLKRHAPIGCVADVSRGTKAFEPRLFGKIPLVYLDGECAHTRRRVSQIVVDTGTIVRAAFTELRATRPSGYAVVEYRNARLWSLHRVRTFRKLVRDAGAPLRVFNRRKESSARRAARLSAWMARLPPQTGILAVNDDTALEVLAAAQRAGRAVPKDIAVMGIDNVELAAKSAPVGLSSVEIDFERAGYRAAALVDERRQGRMPHVETIGPLMTVRRESTRGRLPAGPAIRQALMRIRTEATMGLRARDVAAMIPGSRRLAELRFRECLGHSILDEINNERLNTVIALLKDKAVPLDEVFIRSGFPSFPALRKAFKLKTGLALTAWRKANG